MDILDLLVKRLPELYFCHGGCWVPIPTYSCCLALAAAAWRLSNPTSSCLCGLEKLLVPTHCHRLLGQMYGNHIKPSSAPSEWAVLMCPAALSGQMLGQGYRTC